ncbi:hypothetical protein ASG17_05505 [Brevundimonas sp. Leaf363]|nr:hypothetical protein ASG17_05505 [Brevundimonas sp. Leaf363]
MRSGRSRTSQDSVVDTPKQRRSIVILIATVFAIVIAQLQMVMGWGQTPSEFAADSDATLKVAGFAFAIWGVIYLWLAVYAVRQVLPQTSDSPLMARLGWPSALALLGIGVWIVAAAFDWEWATVALIFGSAIVLLVPLLAEGGRIQSLRLGSRERWLVVWPLTLLAGWLSIAAPVNLLTILTGNGELPTAVSPTIWAILAVVAVSAAALAVTWRLRVMAYTLPIAWGLFGVASAESDRNPPLGLAAAIALGVTLILSAAIVVAHSRRVER